MKNRAAEAAQFGNSYYRQGRYDLALQFFTQALNENLSVDNEPGVVQSYNSIGRVYLAVGMVDEAETAFLKAQAIAVRLGGESLFVTSNNLGELYLRRGDAAGALETFERVLGGSLAGMPPDQVGLLYHNLGSAYKATGDLDAGHGMAEEGAGREPRREALRGSRGRLLHDRLRVLEAGRLRLRRAQRRAGPRATTSASRTPSASSRTCSPSGCIAAEGRRPRGRLRITSSARTSRPPPWAAAADIRAALEGLIGSGEALGKTAEVAEHRKALAALGSP